MLKESSYLQGWEGSSSELENQWWHICSGFLEQMFLPVLGPANPFLLCIARVLGDQGSPLFHIPFLAVPSAIHCFSIAFRLALWRTELLDPGLATKCLSLSLTEECGSTSSGWGFALPRRDFVIHHLASRFVVKILDASVIFLLLLLLLLSNFFFFFF